MGNSLPHVVIVGGGISGLSTAFAIHEESQRVGSNIDCTLIESAQSWGGKIQTCHDQGMIVEGGPDSFLSIKPWALELCEKLGLSDQLINTNDRNNQTFSYTRGKLRELPQGLVSFIPTRIGALFSSGVISWPGIIRMGADWFIPPRRDSNDDESLASFFSRRLGQEAFDCFIEPLVAGIYAGDGQELSIKATFPRFLELEQKHGGLIKGVWSQRTSHTRPNQESAQKRSMFTTLRGGLGDLVSTLVKRIQTNGTTLTLGQEVKGIHRTPNAPHRYKVILQNDHTLVADAVVLATPAYISAKLLQSCNPTITDCLNDIPYSSTATISLSYRTEDLKKLVHGFGFVVPRKEGKSLIAATWTSLKWHYRTQSGHTLVRCYVGGRGRENILSHDDDVMVSYVREELSKIVGIKKDPLYSKVYRWDRSMPQYTCGHLDRIQGIRTEVQSLQGLYLTGAAYEGIGIPDCIRDGTRVGKEVVNSFL